MTSSYLVVPRVLSIAGTDPSGGAGTAADMKSITAAGGYGMTVVTSIVAQNTHGVRDQHFPPQSVLRNQLEAVSDDVSIDAIKTGMLGSTDTIATVSAWLDEHQPKFLVVDPVMVASSGDRLLQREAEAAMIEFCRRATVVTPNIDELAVLTGQDHIADRDAALEHAQRWATETGTSIVVKTGHLHSRDVSNTWVSPEGIVAEIPSTRVDTTNTHGTGCSLAAALATRLGAGDTPAAALGWATAWLHEAINYGAALEVGSGNGPVDHSHRARRLQAAGMATPWLSEADVPASLESPESLTELTSESTYSEDTPLAPAVEAAGPWTRALWVAGRFITGQIQQSAFVTQLVEGSLPGPAFEFYLAQDALYLKQYARALASLAAASTEHSAQVFWAQGALNVASVESQLHRSRLTTQQGAVPSPVTAAYTNFLLANTLGSPRAVGVAAVLPCYWLYAQTGASLPRIDDAHPYADWLGTYADPGFVDSTQQALQQLEFELEAATPQVRAQAARVYLTACRHELEFFDQALRLDTTTLSANLTTALS